MLKFILTLSGVLFFGGSALAQSPTCLDQLFASDSAEIPHVRFFEALAEITNSPEDCSHILANALSPDPSEGTQPNTTTENLCQSARATWGDIKSTQSSQVLSAFIDYYADCPIYLALAQSRLDDLPTVGFPDKLGPFTIGSIVQEGDTFAELAEDGLSGYIEAITSVENEVTHIVYYEDDASSLEFLLESFSAKLGVPSEDKIDSSLPKYSWVSRDAKQRFSLGLTEPCCGADYQMFSLLETTDPKKLCGSEDGFAAWLYDMQVAIEQDDPVAIADGFSYPFIRWEQMDDPDSDFAENERISFGNAQDMTAALGTNKAIGSILSAVEEIDIEATLCRIVAPEGQQTGYSTYADDVGGVNFVQQKSGWKIHGTFYTP